MKGWIQVAGIRDAAEARLCREAGADLLGFPFRLPVHREDLSEAAAAGLIAELGLGSRAVLITYLERAEAIAELADFLGTGWVQLHGAISPAELRALRARRPQLRLIRSLVIRGGDAAGPLATLQACEPWVNAFLTDSHDPLSGADGATGRVHDWSVSRQLRAATTRPLILAGGLRPANVAAAIRAVGPAAVDAHTGLEDASGAKDPARLAAFVAAARRAFRKQDEPSGSAN
ncbi:MAG: phosphoribosylanthranilate isomerase [Candidatus Delongbacteria bacterium]